MSDEIERRVISPADATERQNAGQTSKNVQAAETAAKEAITKSAPPKDGE